MARRYVPGSGWGAVQTVDTGAGNADQPGISVNESGDALVVWRQVVGAQKDIMATWFISTTGWSGSISPLDTGSGLTYAPHVAVNDTGDAIVAWEQDNGSTDFDMWAIRYIAGAGMEQRFHPGWRRRGL